MSEACSHDCSSCGESCGERTAPQDLRKPCNELSHVKKVIAVMSGKGGDIIMETASRVMDEEYPDVAFRPEAPDEKTRRVGQSAAAASLPELK